MSLGGGQPCWEPQEVLHTHTPTQSLASPKELPTYARGGELAAGGRWGGSWIGWAQGRAAFILRQWGRRGAAGPVCGKPQVWVQGEGASGQADVVFAKVIKQQIGCQVWRPRGSVMKVGKRKCR